MSWGFNGVWWRFSTGRLGQNSAKVGAFVAGVCTGRTLSGSTLISVVVQKFSKIGQIGQFVTELQRFN